MAAVEELRYTRASLDLRDKVSKRISEKIVELATLRTTGSGRKLVTEEDVRASVQEAIQMALRELGFDMVSQPSA